MKKLLAILLSTILLLACVPLGAIPAMAAAVEEKAAVRYAVSGDLNASKPTKDEIRAMWKTVTHDNDVMYAEEPHTSAPYSTGKLTDGFLDNGLTFLNFVRYVAGVPSVQLDAEKNDSAQHGAVLLAAADVLSHHPAQPDDMADDFYDEGFSATMSSNIGSGHLDLADFVLGCMDDEGSVTNLTSVGHRRWFLYPRLHNVGFGFAEYYSVAKVDDFFGGKGCDYEFISWPSSGNFPNRLFDASAPWSVDLNGDMYETPVLENITVTITQESDGTAWRIADPFVSMEESLYNGYLSVDEAAIRGDCIIFHPGTKNVTAFDGVYTVTIDGLYTTDGEKTTLSYQVDFFDLLCGPAGDCWWEQDGTHLTISGQGTASGPLWYDYDCSDITSITIEEGVVGIDNSAFWGYESLASVTIPDSVTSIGDGVFSWCTSLTSVHIPDSVTSIDDRAFYWCTSLTSVTIPDGITTIGDQMFYNCTSLTSVHIPDGVTSIGDGAFSGCSSLTSVTIPDSVTSIGDDAFSWCTSLTSISFGAGLTYIGEAAFDDCSSLTDVYYGGSTYEERENIVIEDYNWRLDEADWHYNKCMHVFDHVMDRVCDMCGFVRHPVEMQYRIENGEVIITEYTDSNINNPVIPSTIEGYPVTTIGDNAFEWCTALVSITLPDSITTIGEYAFNYCCNLSSITLPDRAVRIGYCAFQNTAYYDDANNWDNQVLYVGNHLIEAKRELSGAYAVRPGTRTIADDAFAYCASLTAVTIPAGVIAIGDYAFYGCSSLTSVDVRDGVVSLGKYAFADCSSLETVVLPDSITSMGERVFAWCSSLRSVNIPRGITEISYETFNGCTSLTSVVIPRGVTSIGEYAFYNCSSLTSVVIPNSVTTLGIRAFYNCSSLPSVEFPKSVTNIGASAFSGCDSLDDVYYGGTEADRANMVIGEWNYELAWATWHYNHVVEPDPEPELPTEPAATPGDLNGDGNINNRDLGLMQQYLNGRNVTVDEDACDVNGDGNINNRDLALLQRYLNGWDVTLGK